MSEVDHAGGLIPSKPLETRIKGLWNPGVKLSLTALNGHYARRLSGREPLKPPRTLREPLGTQRGSSFTDGSCLIEVGVALSLAGKDLRLQLDEIAAQGGIDAPAIHVGRQLHGQSGVG